MALKREVVQVGDIVFLLIYVSADNDRVDGVDDGGREAHKGLEKRSGRISAASQGGLVEVEASEKCLSERESLMPCGLACEQSIGDGGKLVRAQP
jgi:hypothetical protein